MDVGRIKETIKKRAVKKRIKRLRQDVAEGQKTVHFLPQQEMHSITMASDAVHIPSQILSGKRDGYIKAQLKEFIGRMYAEGQIPAVMSAVMIFPCDTCEEELRFLMGCLAEETERFSIQLAGVEAECSMGVCETVVSLSLTGILLGEEQTVDAFVPGSELVLAGNTGTEGALLLEQAGRERLMARFSKRYLDSVQMQHQEWLRECNIQSMTEIVRRAGQLSGIYAVGRSGVFGALWEMASLYKNGFDVRLENIPIAQETIEISEFFDVNPYLLPSGGCLLVAAQHGQQMAEQFLDKGIPAAVLGSIRRGADKRVFYGEEQRFLSMPEAVKIARNAPEGMKWLY